MRQRAMIAMALAGQPRLLIADEPTTALDVTVQAQVFDLLRDVRRQFGTAIILITHNMGAIAELADRVMVMYAGRKIEEGRWPTCWRVPRIRTRAACSNACCPGDRRCRRPRRHRHAAGDPRHGASR